MHGLFRKYYVTDDVLCDAVSSAIWDEKLQNGRKKAALLATTAIWLLRQARRRRKSPTCWVRGWLRRRDESGFTNTLITELECSHKTEY